MSRCQSESCWSWQLDFFKPLCQASTFFTQRSVLHQLSLQIVFLTPSTQPHPPLSSRRGVVACHTLHLYCAIATSSRGGRWVWPLASSPLTGPPLTRHNGFACPCNTHRHMQKHIHTHRGGFTLGLSIASPPYAPSPLECYYPHLL